MRKINIDRQMTLHKSDVSVAGRDIKLLMEPTTGRSFRKMTSAKLQRRLKPHRGESSTLLIIQFVVYRERGQRHMASAQFVFSEAPGRQVLRSGLMEDA